MRNPQFSMLGGGQCNDPAIGRIETIPYTRSKNVVDFRKLKGKSFLTPNAFVNVGASLSLLLSRLYQMFYCTTRATYFL